jgi:hypothetical protein
MLEDFRSDFYKRVIISPTHIMMSRDLIVIIDGFWIDDMIYWTLSHILVSTVTYLLAVAL